MQNNQFPKGFFWGAGTSSYQIEGGNFNCDWYEWEKEKGLEQCGKADDSYHRYEEDFDLAQKLNHNTHRFSLEWSRINPREGVFDQKEIEHYRKVIRALRKRGMEPFVTLHHFTLPLWVSHKGGFGSRKIVKYFGDYVSYVIKHLGNEAKFWITINEPLVLASAGCINKKWPPGKGGVPLFLKMYWLLIRTHRRAYRVIKQINPELQVGVAKNNWSYQPILTHPVNIFKYPFVRFADFVWNKLFLNAIRKQSDFIGLNHYNWIDLGTSFAKLRAPHLVEKRPNRVVSDMGWDIVPESMYYVLKNLKKYHLPIYITENGVADAEDKLRKNVIHDYLAQLLRAIQEGVDVRGYFYWSLLDNFEWSDGFKMRFGLIKVDYPTQKRTVRESGWYYARICQNNRLE